jgi:homoserine trans-succinylase
MPLLLDTLRPGPAVDLRGRNCLTIGLVNNMPDAACEATERQFIELLRAAASDVVVLLKFFSVAAVPRCEAAHAAMQYADGIVRERLSDKLSGVFDCEVTGDHPLVAGVAQRWLVPHSRLNDLPEAPLAAGGYRVLSRSAATGADTFIKEQDGGSLFVFVQGHPEYDTDSLLREYRRDLGRFLRSEAGAHPQAPQNYFDSARDVSRRRLSNPRRRRAPWRTDWRISHAVAACRHRKHLALQRHCRLPQLGRISERAKKPSPVAGDARAARLGLRQANDVSRIMIVIARSDSDEEIQSAGLLRPARNDDWLIQY